VECFFIPKICWQCGAKERINVDIHGCDTSNGYNYIIIIIIIIITDKKDFLTITFLTRFYQISSGFHFFGFRNNTFLYKARSSALRPTPQPGDLSLCNYGPVTGWSRYNRRHPGSIFVAFY
jgi:hypothetical protein